MYHETQRMFGGFLLLAIIIPVGLFVMFQFRTQPLISRILSAIVMLVGSFIIVVLCMLRLDTWYYSDRIEYQFVSVFKAKYEVVKAANIRNARIIIYNPEDFGGWGMKGNASTRVYNASGNKGLLLSFYTGKSLLLGTQQPDSLYARIKDKYPFQLSMQ